MARLQMRSDNLLQVCKFCANRALDHPWKSGVLLLSNTPDFQVCSRRQFLLSNKLSNNSDFHVCPRMQF